MSNENTKTDKVKKASDGLNMPIMFNIAAGVGLLESLIANDNEVNTMVHAVILMLTAMWAVTRNTKLKVALNDDLVEKMKESGLGKSQSQVPVPVATPPSPSEI